VSARRPDSLLIFLRALSGHKPDKRTRPVQGFSRLGVNDRTLEAR
jgi:hypothetical protein